MKIQDYEAAVEAAETPQALWEVFSSYFHGTDVTRVVYLHLPPMGAPDNRRPGVKAEGYPEELVCRYVQERLYRDNPVLRYGQSRVEPIYWDQIDKLGPLSEREEEFLAGLQAAGLGNGVGIHVYGPNGRNGQCGLGFRPGVRRLEPGVLYEAQWVCQFAHLRYCGMIADIMGPPPDLTPRESEVLAWVARGKSNKLIGDILGISAHTVDAHLRRVYVKLGVFDRISATVYGIGVGLIRAEI